MWTERIRYINSINEIKDYVENMDCFHDYVFGHFDYDGNKACIMLETMPAKKDISNDNGLVWDFNFINVTSFYIDHDCYFRFFNKELVIEENEFIFELDQGMIRIKADNVTLGIPK